jgi:HPt (histidine-containing phosphotransfer) domain-containing protein
MDTRTPWLISAQTGMPPPSLLDRAVINDLSACIGIAGVHKILILFIRESRAYAKTIAQAVAPGSDAASHDWARRVAHSLKSSAGQVGAMSLATLAASFELAAGDGAADLVQGAASLQHCTEDTVAALKEFLAE